MESIRTTQKRYCSRALAGAVAICLILIAAGQPAIGKGLVLGTLFGVINFVLMGETIAHRIGKSRSRTTAIALVSIGFRYLLMAVPLVMALKMKQFNFVSAVVGIFSVHLVILAEQVAIIVTSPRNTNQI